MKKKKMQESTRYWLIAMAIVAVGTVVTMAIGYAGVPVMNLWGIIIVTLMGFVVFSYRAMRTDYNTFKKKRGKKNARKKAATRGVGKTKIKKKR